MGQCSGMSLDASSPLAKQDHNVGADARPAGARPAKRPASGAYWRARLEPVVYPTGRGGSGNSGSPVGCVLQSTGAAAHAAPVSEVVWPRAKKPVWPAKAPWT